jgi:hypothetical protein
MSLLDIVAILALTGWAVYKQTKVTEIVAKSRFKMAIIYGIVGFSIGGFDTPSGAPGLGMLGFGLMLSVVVGLARGQLTHIWMESDGRILRKGSALTVGLFLGMIAVKFALGAVASIAHIDDGAGFGEVLVMIALMIAAQAQLMWHRAQHLPAPSRLVPVAV